MLLSTDADWEAEGEGSSNKAKGGLGKKGRTTVLYTGTRSNCDPKRNLQTKAMLQQGQEAQEEIKHEKNKVLQDAKKACEQRPTLRH